MLKVPSSMTRLVSWMWTSAPTRFVTFFNSSGMSAGSPQRCFAAATLAADSGSPVTRPESEKGLLCRRPALDQFVISDRFARGLLVRELRRWAIRLAQPFFRVLFRVGAGAAAAVGLGLFVGCLHSGHDLIHFLSQPVHCLFRRERARIH